MVRRLDVKTTGLLLFSNYAPWAHELMHPKFNHERRYQVTVRVESRMRPSSFEQGVMLEDGEAKASKVIWQPLGPKKHQCILTMKDVIALSDECGMPWGVMSPHYAASRTQALSCLRALHQASGCILNTDPVL